MDPLVTSKARNQSMRRKVVGSERDEKRRIYLPAKLESFSETGETERNKMKEQMDDSIQWTESLFSDNRMNALVVLVFNEMYILG